MSELSAERIRKIVSDYNSDGQQEVCCFCGTDYSVEHGHDDTGFCWPCGSAQLQYVLENILPTIADALDKCERLEKALERIANWSRGPGDGPPYYTRDEIRNIARIALAQPEGGKQ